MSKRLLCFLFACVFCLSFVACGTDTRDDGKVVLLSEEDDIIQRYRYHEEEYREIPFLTITESAEDILIGRGEDLDYYAATDADAPPYFYCRRPEGRSNKTFCLCLGKAYDERSMLFAIEGIDDTIAYADVFSGTPVLLEYSFYHDPYAYILMKSKDDDRICMLVGLVQNEEGWYGKAVCSCYRGVHVPLSDEFVALLRRHGYIAPEEAAETAASAEADVVTTP